MKKTTLVAKFAFCCWLLAALSGTVFAQAVLVDLGTNSSGVPIPPVPGPLDITNITSGADVQFPDVLNYYDNNNNGLNPGGQTFHVPYPMLLTSVALQLGGDYSSGPTIPPPSLGPALFWLRIFSIEGTSATLVAAYPSQPNATLMPNHWMQWTNIACLLISASGNFAYTFGCDPSYADGWMQLWAVNGDTYPGGQICLIANAGGANSVTYGAAGIYDANFCLGFENLMSPFPNTPIVLPTNTIFLGSPVTLYENAGGQPPLYYQWQTDGGGGGTLTNIPGALTNFYATTPPAIGTWNYDIVVSNGYGPVTSSVAVVTVLPASPPLLTTDIGIYNTNVYGFVGGSVNFYANFGLGTMPITNQWLAKLDSGGDYAPVAGAASSAWTLANVQSTSAGFYELAATNAVGRSNSTPAHLTALARPAAPTTTNLFAYCVLTNNPWAYWRFEETNDTLTSSMQAYDYSGHDFDATYGNSTGVAGTGCLDGGENITNGCYGPRPVDGYFGLFETNNGSAGLAYNKANGYLTVPPLNLNTNTVTFTMWIRPKSDIVNPNTGLLMWHNGMDVAGVGFGVDLDWEFSNSRSMAELGYTWNTNSPTTYYFHSHLYPLAQVWSFAAWVISPSSTTIYLYYVANGQTNLLKAVQVINNTPESFSGGTTCLGTDNFNNGRTFDGSIDEVAVFTNSLSETQIQAMFLRSLGLFTGIPATISVPPQPVTVWQGQPLRMTVNGGGIPVPTWQ